MMNVGEPLKKAFKKVPGLLHIRLRSDLDEITDLIVDFKNAAVYKAGDAKAGDSESKLFVFMNDLDFVHFITGQMPLGSALMNAKLKVSGDLTMLPILQALIASVRSKL